MYLKPQPFVNKRHNAVIASLIFLGTLLIYYLTFARSLSFWDAGEYITCSSILGIPHPPGNPFYILIGRFFTILGIGIPHAQIVNFLSSIFSAFAVMFTYLFTVKLITMWLTSEKESFYAYLGGFIAAVYTAFSYTFWTNAIEAEVYSGLAFILNLIVWLTLVWVEKSEGLSHQNLLLLIIYIFFLGFGIHQTSLQLAPAVLFIVLYPQLKENIRKSGFWPRLIAYIIFLVIAYAVFIPVGKSMEIPDLSKYVVAVSLFAILYYHHHKDVAPRTWLLAFFFILVGLSTHFFLLVRSHHRPFINEGHPHNLSLFTDYVLRRQYGTTSMFVRRANFFYQLYDQFLTYFSWQFFNVEMISRWFKVPAYIIQRFANLIVFLLGTGGFIYHIKKNKHSFAYFFSFFFMASIAMIFVMNLSDAEVRERDYFFVTAYNFWTVWMAIGSIAVIDFFRRKKRILGLIFAAIMLFFPIFNLVSQYHVHDRSREYIALDYGQNILNSVDENAIIFTNGDNDTFPVWYAQAVYDPAATEYIHPDPDSLPGDITGHQMKLNTLAPTDTTREIIASALEYKNEQCNGIRKDVTIANLSLLNTPWYIKQLRDKEGIEFNIPDKHIDLSQDSPASVLYPRQIPKDSKLTISGPTPGDSFTISFKKGTILFVKDLAVLQIIKDNYGKRPIYFAVTAPDVVGFENHLQNEGMVDRLVATASEEQYDLERLVTNIDSIYSYRGIFDDTIYKDHNMKRLLNNYGAAYMRASRYFHAQMDYGNAIDYMEKSLEFIEGKQRFYYGLAQLYVEAGYYLLELGMIDEGFMHLENAIYYNRYDPSLIQIISQAAEYVDEPQKGIDLLRKLSPYQDSLSINRFIRNLEALESEKN